MCGRYQVDEVTLRHVQRIVAEVDRRIRGLKPGDGLPSHTAAVIREFRDALGLEPMGWGFPARGSGQLLINARAETALEKPAFSESALRRRCAIPAAAFYEWNPRRERVTFRSPQGDILYLAGLWSQFGGERRFTILTTAANASAAAVHDRMPLILGEEMLGDWILRPEKTEEFLRLVPAALTATQEYEQLSLF